MIPIQDTVPSRRFPLINTLLIALNVLVFLYEVSLRAHMQEAFVFEYGLIPTRFWASQEPIRWMPVLTSMFLHGGWWHLISNMMALYIFGDNVEDRMGHLRYLIFYLVGGVIAGLAHVWVYPASSIPTVGASGAISAVLGAYFILFPLARVITLFPFPLFFFPIVEIPALFYLGFWFISQLFNGAFALAIRTYQGSGVAWWAHIGGFVAGMALVHLFAFQRRPPRHPLRRHDYFYPDEYRPW